jgi:alginate O-acetyltransferase complex protein AlgI
MLFNSIQFAFFLPIVFLLYWFVTSKNLRLQNLLLLFSSYVFYGWWDYRFLFLLIFSTLLDYFTGLQMGKINDQKSKRIWFWLSIVINLGFLAFFKYYNFFITSFYDLISSFGLKPNLWTLKIILPVGISFYTFHGMSYVTDIYYDRIKPTKNFIDYALFVSFFPLLVAGPIERATHLLPQIQRERTFNYSMAVDGLRQILWGLFKKIVIADNCAVYANDVFNHSSGQNGSTLLLGAIFFAIQIYGDFSGYSDIALGVAKLFGVELLRNFAFPYFSRDIAEFWRRWHISLTTWFRDYVYIPLGGSRGSFPIKIRNTFIIFLLSGFWHGANWTFIVWGLLNAIYFIPLLMLKRNRLHNNTVAEGKLLPSLKEAFQILTTFLLTTIAWIFFRADSIKNAAEYLRGIFNASILKVPLYPPVAISIFIFLFILVEWLQRTKQHALQFDGLRIPRIISWSVYYCLIIVTIIFGGQQQEFIYFQF